MSHSKKGGSQWEQAEVEQFYKGYRIEFSVTPDDNAWTVSIFIYYSEGPLKMLVTFPLNQEFKTYHEAMGVGLAAAKKWVDERN